MRFLHLADTHLDTLFAGRDERVRERLRAGSREALRRGLALARQEKVDAVLIAGDLFDGARLSFETERFLAGEMAGLAEAGIPLFVAAGNHDPGGGAFDLSRVHAAPGLHTFLEATPRTHPVWRGDTLVGTITGAGHESAREERDLSRGFIRPTGTFTPPPHAGEPASATPGGGTDRAGEAAAAEEAAVAEKAAVATGAHAAAQVPAVALLHTQVGGARGDGNHDRYAPSTLSHLRETGFDYWALGHIHVRQALSTFPGIHYPGNTAGRSPSESGAKGGLLVELPGRGLAPNVRFVELAPIRWESIEVAGLGEVRTLAGLVRRVQGEWEEARQGDPGLPGGEWLVRVHLAGPLPLHGQLRDTAERSVLEGEIREALGVLDVELRLERAHAPVDVEAGLRRQDAAGEALRQIRAFRSPEGPSPSVVLGLTESELAGRLPPEGIDAYLRGLLEGAEADLLARFLDEGGGAS